MFASFLAYFCKGITEVYEIYCYNHNNAVFPALLAVVWEILYSLPSFPLAGKILGLALSLSVEQLDLALSQL